MLDAHQPDITRKIIAEMRGLARQFGRIGDAWAGIDNRINAGFALLKLRRRADAQREFAQALKTSNASGYRVGAAMATKGLVEMGRKSLTLKKDRDFCEEHLNRLFRAKAGLRFVPTYVLSLP